MYNTLSRVRNDDEHKASKALRTPGVDRWKIFIDMKIKTLDEFPSWELESPASHTKILHTKYVLRKKIDNLGT